jgi:hypothetical protein
MLLINGWAQMEGTKNTVDGTQESGDRQKATDDRNNHSD